MKEIWVDVSGFEGKYKISSLGRVKSLKRIVRTWNGTKTIPEKILKNSKSSNGYIRITLFKNNSHKKFSIHRLVAENFIPNIHNKPCVNHKDENKENNNVSNLEWVTWKENTNYGTCLSRRAKTQKDKKCQLNNKSTSKKIICKNTGKIFPSINEACRFYDLDCSAVSKVCKHKINNTKGLKFEYV